MKKMNELHAALLTALDVADTLKWKKDRRPMRRIIKKAIKRLMKCPERSP